MGRNTLRMYPLEADPELLSEKTSAIESLLGHGVSDMEGAGPILGSGDSDVRRGGTCPGMW